METKKHLEDGLIVERNEDGTLSEAEIERKKSNEEVVLRDLVDLLNMFALMGQKRVTKFLALMLEAGCPNETIRRLETTAANRSNWGRNKYVQHRMESNGLPPKTMVYLRG